MVTPHRAIETKKLTPSHLSDSIDLGRLREDGLNLSEYRACLNHWKEIASAPKWPKAISGVWCREFISRLSENTDEFCSIVAAGMTKVAAERRINYDFREVAGGDPLFYLNLNGVPPIQILYAIEDIQARMEKLKRASNLAKELEVETTQAIARLRKTLSLYDEIFSADKVGQDLNLLESDYANFAQSIAGTVGLKSSTEANKRRTSLNGEFIFAAQILRAVIDSEMNSHVWGEPEPPEREASRRELLLPVIACILKAGWPSWFNGTDVLRKVRAALPTKTREPFTVLFANYPDWWTVDSWLKFIQPYLPPKKDRGKQ